MKKFRFFFRFVSLLVLLGMFFGFPANTEAQSDLRFTLVKVDDSLFPQVNINISIFDTLGHPEKNLVTGNFKLYEDGREITDMTLSSINNSEQPIAYMFVVDTSNDFWLPQTKGIAKIIMGSLKAEDRAGLLSFSNEFTVERNLETGLPGAQDVLGNLKAGGKPPTALNDALMESLKLLQNQSEPRVLLLFHNSIDSNISSMYERFIGEATKSAVQVYLIGLGESARKFSNEFATIADRSGGKEYIYPDIDLKSDTTPEEIEEKLHGMFEDLKTRFNSLQEQYLIQYTSTHPEDGTEIEIRVATDYQGWHAEQAQKVIACPGDVKVCLPGFKANQVVSNHTCFKPVAHSLTSQIKRIDISMDGQLVSNLTASPFEYCLDPLAVKEGTHKFDFVAMDDTGKTGQLTIDLFTRPPVKVEIENPVDNAKVRGTVKISATVDTLQTVKSVSFFVGDNLLKMIENAPFEVEWNTNNYLNDQNLRVVAEDVDGYIGEASITVKVDNIVIEGPGTGLWIGLIAVILVFTVMVSLVLRNRRQRQGGTESSVQGGAVLRELEGLSPNKSWVLAKPEVRLGRKAAENDIVLKGTIASRNMAVIRREEGGHTIYSLNSQNPVIVDNVPIQQQTLQNGNVIRAGESLFRFEAEG